MLDTAFTAIGSKFSTRFLLGQFFPVFAVMVVNILLGCLYFWGWDASLATITGTLKIADLAAGVGIVAFAASVVAFTLAPMLNALRRLLEGDLFPEFIRTSLIKANKEWAGELETEIGEITSYATQLQKRREAAVAVLRTPVPPAPPLAPPAEPEPPTPWEQIFRAVASLLDIRWPGEAAAAVKPAESAATAVETPKPKHVAIDATAATAAVEALETNLRAAEGASVRTRWNKAVGDTALASLLQAKNDLVALKDLLGGAYDETFDRLHGRFIAAVDEALPVAARLLSDRKSALRLAYVRSDPRPTRFGNLTAALENYPLAVYGVGYDYLWPRIELVLSSDEAKSKLLTEPRTQLDYAMVALLLAMLSCIGWLGILIATDTSPLRFALVGLGTWIGFHLFYRVALEAQRNLTEAIKSILDRYRWDLLKELHVAPPTDSGSERALWRSLQSVSAGIRLRPPLAYEKPE